MPSWLSHLYIKILRILYVVALELAVGVHIKLFIALCKLDLKMNYKLMSLSLEFRKKGQNLFQINIVIFLCFLMKFLSEADLL